jgi:hypothetical protein
LQDELPPVREAVVEDGVSERLCRTCTQGAKWLELDLNFANVGHCGIRSVERTIG